MTYLVIVQGPQFDVEVVQKYIIPKSIEFNTFGKTNLKRVKKMTNLSIDGEFCSKHTFPKTLYDVYEHRTGKANPKKPEDD